MTSPRRIGSCCRGSTTSWIRNQGILYLGLEEWLLASDPAPRRQREDNVLHRLRALAVHCIPFDFGSNVRIAKGVHPAGPHEACLVDDVIVVGPDIPGRA